VPRLKKGGANDNTTAFIIIIIFFTISSTGVNTERSRRSNEWERIG